MTGPDHSRAQRKSRVEQPIATRGVRSPPSSGPDNAAVAAILRELAARLELDGVEHSPRAYRRAADGIERERGPVATRYAEQGVAGLDALPGVGAHIARTLAELFDRGRIERLDRLRDKTGVDVLGLLAIDGIGPKRLRTLWRELRVRSVEDLEQAVAQRCLQGLPGFGVRSEERLGEILELRRRSSRRMALARARTIAQALHEALERHPKVIRCEIAGSIRRRRKDVGDIDLVVASNDADAVAHDFLEREDIALVHAKGPHRISVALDAGIDCDVRVVPPEAFGSALLYFTGSRAHTIALRQLALAQGLHLNEYGLYRGKRKIAGESEEGIYAALSLPWLPPEKRRGQSEIRDALRGLRNDAR